MLERLVLACVAAREPRRIRGDQAMRRRDHAAKLSQIQRRRKPAALSFPSDRGTEDLERAERGGTAGFDPQMNEDVQEMLFHGGLADAEDGGDVGVGLALGQQALGFYAKAYEFALYPRRVFANPLVTVLGPVFAAAQGEFATMAAQLAAIQRLRKK